MESRGIIMFNRGDKIVVRAIVALYSLRKYWDGPITFYVEKPYPEEFDSVLRFFNCDIVHNEERHDFKTLVRKNSLFENPPYDRTLWIDADVIVNGKLDQMFDYLDDYDMAIPHFAGWVSSGRHISERINRFKGIAEERHITEALKDHSAVNTGVLSFRKSEKWAKFVHDWTDLANRASQKHVFIPDEVACQILYPSIGEWGLKCFVAPTEFNVSVLHDHGQSKNPKIYHYHGDKHVLNVPTCDEWKATFKEMCDKNIAHINSFLKYSDKRLSQYLKQNNNPDFVDTTIVTACDEYYVEILKHTFPNWRQYKNIDKYPVLVFVHGMDVATDKRLDFLRLPNVKMIPWSMANTENHREEMLSAFVFGTADNVTTEFWLKLDADSYATDSKPFIDEKMKSFAFCGHKWGYSRPDHIKKLDQWAKGHWKRKLRKSPPMLTEGKEEGHRFYHKVKRTISFIQMHKTRFTKFCVSLIKADEKTGLKRLPAPTQDTFMFYVANRFDPDTVGSMNFKKDYGFTQGRGKMGAEHIKQCVEAINATAVAKDNDESESEEVE